MIQPLARSRTFRRLAVGLVLLMVTAAAAGGESGNPAAFAAGPGATALQGEYVPGEILVKFRPSSNPAGRRMAVERLGGRELPARGRHPIARVRLPPGLSVAEAANAYGLHADIEHAQPNYIYRPSAVPNDARFDELWGLRNSGQPVRGIAGLEGRDLGIEAVWDHVTDCSPVVVAVLDTGVNYTHTDLAENMWDGGERYPNHGWDFVDDDADPMPADASGHGTHVAGTIGAVGDNRRGTSGICWRARIMAVRVLTDGGGTTADIVRGIDFALENGAGVINMSLGGPAGVYDSIFSAAVADAAARDVVVVTAAGNAAANNDTEPMVPCAFEHENLLCVAALDQHFNIAGFSNWGETSVDVGAPGVNILSTWPGRRAAAFSPGSWIKKGDWSEVFCNLGYGPEHLLVNPSGWCEDQRYADGAQDVAYRRLDLSNTLVAAVDAYVAVDLEPGRDTFSVAYRKGRGDPFAPGATIVVDAFSGPTEGFEHMSFALTDCLAADCTLGFRLTSDRRRTERGIAVTNARLRTAEDASGAFEYVQGTSMAAPHVAGLAALLRAYNPDYNYADVVAAIEQGGTPLASLEGFTATGKAVNALGSLVHIRPPSGLSATVR